MRLAILALLLMASQAYGAITVIGHAAGDPSGLASLSTTGGNLILCWVSSDTPGNVCFDNQNVPAYTSVGCSPNGSGQTVCLSYLYNFPTPGTTTFDTAAGFNSVYVLVVAGAADPAAATIQTAVNSGSGAVSVSLTPNCTNSLVITGFHANAITPTLTGLTQDDAQFTFGGSWGGGAGHTIQTTATATTAAWTVSTGPNAAMIASILATTSVCAGGPAWGTWNGQTVGSSSGNISAWDGKTIGVSSGNIGSYNGLASQ